AEWLGIYTPCGVFTPQGGVKQSITQACLGDFLIT
ncbi:hypothetical protein BHECKSOX_1089, partial [Bathymodiolus heckerae thiotrophic gill symbiont]